MKFSKNDYKPEELLKRAYNAREQLELCELLELIERIINLHGNDKSLDRAKSVVTTKLILKP